MVVVLAAFTISFAWPVENGLRIDIDTSPRALAARQKTPYDLNTLIYFGQEDFPMKCIVSAGGWYDPIEAKTCPGFRIYRIVSCCFLNFHFFFTFCR